MSHFMSPLRPRFPSREPSSLQAPSADHATNGAEPPHEKKAEDNPSEEPEIPEILCISEGTFRQIRDDSLVLLSQGIEHRLFRSEDGPFQIFILPEHEAKAKLQLQLYHKENPPKQANPPLPLTFSLQPLWILLVPVAFTFLQFADDSFYQAGVSNAGKVMQGQWWRSITALTLHADARHLIGNLVSGYIVMNMISYRIPLLRIAPFLALASAVANFCVSATVHNNPAFTSLGYSTLVFAAIGCLAVMEFRLMPAETRGLLRRFAPLCGAASLSVFLGLGENADVLGHLYGFIAGILCGFIPTKKTLRWGAPLTKTDVFWFVAYYGIFAVGWLFARGIF